MEKITNNIIGDFYMRKRSIYIIVIILVFIILITNKTDEFRIRVIANSELESDVELKELIALDINEYLIKYKVTKDNVHDHLDCLKGIVDKYHIEYTMVMKYENFPTKMINGKISKGGYYEALVITIGEGNGPNYFTVLYPEYYNVDYDMIQNGEVEYRSFIFDKLQELFNKS